MIQKKKQAMVIRICLFIVLAAVGVLAIGYLSSYLGWYNKSKYRKHSTSIEESVSRGVFVAELKYRVDSFYGAPFKFEAFIEKGFRWGRHSSDQTISLDSTNYPYQLSFNYRPNPVVTIRIRDDQIKKMDSAGNTLRKPMLSDTIILEIGGEGIQSGIIKVWN